MRSSDPAGPTEYEVRIEVASAASNSCLLKLMTVFHSRGVPVVDLHFTAKGQRGMSVRFLGSEAQASTVRKSLLRCVEVTGVSDIGPWQNETDQSKEWSPPSALVTPP